MKRALALMIGALFFIMLYSGCSGDSAAMFQGKDEYSSEATSSAGISMDIGSSDASAENGGDALGGEVAEAVSDRKIIREIDYTLETKDFDSLIQDLQSAVEDANGYIESSSIDSSENTGAKHARFTARIPVSSTSGFTDFIESSANVLNKTESGDDVTLQYYDTETRLESLRIQQARVTELLEETTKMSDILEIENELTRIRTEIEELTTLLRRLDNLTEYATVTVSIEEVDIYEPAVENTFGGKIREAFSSSMRFFWETTQTLCIILIWALPFLLVIGVIVTVVLLICRRRKKKKDRILAEQIRQIQNEQDT